MLIKYYNTDSDVILIDGVEDVTILNHYENKPDENKVSEYFFDDLEALSAEADVKPCARVIEFAKDGPCRLFVFGTAYICNDQGKTIEKVVSGPLIV